MNIIESLKFCLSKAKGICFDWDGTVANTLPLYRILDKTVILELCGVEPSINVMNELLTTYWKGASSAGQNAYNLALYKTYDPLCEMTDQQILELVYTTAEKVLPEISANVEMFPGTLETLLYLREHFDAKCALVTGSGRKHIDFFSSEESKIGRIFKANEFFDPIITSDMIENLKPNPESYILAANLLGAEPSEIIVVEDSFSGVTAGKDAGATVIAIAEEHNAHTADKIRAAADFYFDSWTHLYETISAP